jgi:hypothetical protein
MAASDLALAPLAEGVWTTNDPTHYLGWRLTATMTVLRLADGSLLLHSPVSMTDARRAAVAAIGPIAHLYAPNAFHHTWIGQWASALPAARLHAPAALARKRRDLRIDRTIGAAPEPSFEGVIDEIPIAGFRLEETAIVHRPSRTVVVADLVQNVGQPSHAWTKFYSNTTGFYDRVALSRMLRWTAFSDRAAARRSVDNLLGRPFDRVVVGHGTPLTEGARESLAAAYGWLS